MRTNFYHQKSPHIPFNADQRLTLLTPRFPEMESHYSALAGLELVPRPQLASNSQYGCLYLPQAGITGQIKLNNNNNKTHLRLVQNNSIPLGWQSYKYLKTTS